MDKFATAIGLIVNMKLEPGHPSKLRSFVATGVAPQLAALDKLGLNCENLEYLKGETHYIACTMRKKTLLSRGVLKEDVAGGAAAGLLSESNVNLEPLLQAGRELANFIGIPSDAPFADFHPVKLFDFSSRARCIAPFRVLGVHGKDASPICLDLEICGCLRDAHTRHLAHEVEREQAAVGERAGKVKENASQAERLTKEVASAQSAVKAAGSNAHAKQQALAKGSELEAQLAKVQRARPALDAEEASAREKLAVHIESKAAWAKLVKQSEGSKVLCPIFPVGDALLEPFWPQGLGSNRGFHSALDAAWAMAEMQRDGSIERALIERAFSYDVMLHATFEKVCVQSGSGWTADPTTRYVPPLIKGTMRTYEDPQSKRSHKGRPAIPARYLALLEGATLSALGGKTSWR